MQSGRALLPITTNGLIFIGPRSIANIGNIIKDLVAYGTWYAKDYGISGAEKKHKWLCLDTVNTLPVEQYGQIADTAYYKQLWNMI